MNNENAIRELLSGYFSTVDVDPATGYRVMSYGKEPHVSRGSFLAGFEVERIITELKKLV